MRRRLPLVSTLALFVLAGACASAPLRPPSMQVAGLKVGEMGLTGVSLDVRFRVRNPNERAIKIERFEYELAVNGQNMGRGFQPYDVKIEPFEDREVVSRFDLNLLKLPGVVKSVLGEKQVDAHVEGLFYVKGTSPLPFSSDARIDIGKR
ncbi:MAG TPA: LEA type 2 family protein [Vicinamibacteria bacterium]